MNRGTPAILFVGGLIGRQCVTMLVANHCTRGNGGMRRSGMMVRLVALCGPAAMALLQTGAGAAEVGRPLPVRPAYVTPWLNVWAGASWAFNNTYGVAASATWSPNHNLWGDGILFRVDGN